MASKKSSTTPATTTQAAGHYLPPGMEILASSGPMQWAQISDDAEQPTPEALANNECCDNVIEGELLGKEEMAPDSDGEVRSYYRICLTRPCKVEYKNDGEKVESIAVVGDVVNVGERQKLNPLDALIASGNRYRVFLHAAEKIRIGKGKTMWTFTIGKSIIAPVTPPSLPGVE